MSNSALLNNVDHKDLRVITRRGPEYGDAVMAALTFPSEFREIQAHYPIVFGKTAEGSFQPLALLGFVEGENLFLDDGKWDAPYVPLTVERQPFMIGRGGANGDELMVHVDLDSPRLSTTVGEPVFLPHGGTTEYIERMNSMLLTIHQGIQATPAFIAALLEHELIESFVLDIELEDGSQNRLAGFYTINEDRLAKLSADALERLHRPGYLHAIYMAVASLSRFPDLIARKNRRPC